MIVLVYQVPKKAAPRVPVCQLFSCCTRLAGALGTECESCLGSLSDQETRGSLDRGSACPLGLQDRGHHPSIPGAPTPSIGQTEVVAL